MPANVDTRTGLDPAPFMAHYWQQRPLLVRSMFPAFASPVSGDDLAALACEPEALARLLIGPRPGNCWEVAYGPFDAERFEQLPDRDWTLLVQDLDKWDPDCAELLDAFRFLPEWRLDDIMASFAAPGGSVGAHADRYDVFLIQAEGRRRWQIDASCDPDLSPIKDLEINLLENFSPTNEWTLEPGDVLYLPPGVPHHGVAIDPCITLSVGLRAPSHGELLGDLAEHLADGDDRRLTDPGRRPAADPGLIDEETLAAVRGAVSELATLDDEALATWFASFITRYRLPDPPGEQPAPSPAGCGLRRSPWSRWAWIPAGDAALLFVDGQRFPCSRRLARRLTGARQFATDDFRSADRALIEALCAAGALESEDG